MFGRKKWVNEVLIEGEKSARLVSRMEKLPDVNPDYDYYPVDMKLPKKRSFMEAVRKSVEYSKAGIYNMFYKLR